VAELRTDAWVALGGRRAVRVFTSDQPVAVAIAQPDAVGETLGRMPWAAAAAATLFVVAIHLTVEVVVYSVPATRTAVLGLTLDPAALRLGCTIWVVTIDEAV
jgi:hypothetical protein